jgi:hypothetical protein
MPPYHKTLVDQLEDVVVRGAPAEAFEQLREYDFFGLLCALNVLEKRGSLTPTPEHWHRIQSLLRARVDSRYHSTRPSWLLYSLIRQKNIWQKALVAEFLIVECGAGIEKAASNHFLRHLYGDDRLADVRAVFDRHWRLLLERGLDVNGIYNGGDANLLVSNIGTPTAIERALERGANPNIRHGTPSVGLLEEARRQLETNRWPTERDKFRQSMAHVRAAQNALYLDRALARAPSMAQFSPEVRHAIVREATGRMPYPAVQRDGWDTLHPPHAAPY